ncbi:MAG: hypothetical protein ABSB87_03025 [Terriglobales bacterium]|jgi:hypothetical protein
MSSYLDKYSDNICIQRKSDGDPCKSRALRGESVCHYHKVMGTPKINIDNGPSSHTYLPRFEDAVSIQSGISDVCEMMLHRRIDPKEASILLYAMQVASTNMAHMNGEARRKHKRQTNNQKSGAESSSVAPSPEEAPTTPENTAASSSEPQPLPPGTIQACEQKG